jgi:hypothetical protein
VAYNEEMLRALGYGAVLLLCAVALAACGGSGRFTPSERAAIDAVQQRNKFFRIFPDRPGKISCRIQFGGPVTGYETGRCMTRVFRKAQRTRLDFVEQVNGGTGSFTLILDKRNRIVGQHWQGDVPQMQN